MNEKSFIVTLTQNIKESRHLELSSSGLAIPSVPRDSVLSPVSDSVTGESGMWLPSSCEHHIKVTDDV